MTPLLVNHKNPSEIQFILLLLYSNLWTCVGFIIFFLFFTLIPTF